MYVRGIQGDFCGTQVQCSGTALRVGDRAKVTWERVVTGGDEVAIPPLLNWTTVKMPRFMEKVILGPARCGMVA